MTKPVLLLGLMLAMQPLMAQKTKKAAAPKVITEAAIETSPEIERLEETKIDPVPVFDSTEAPNDALTAALKRMLHQTGAMEAALRSMDLIMEQQESANADPNTRAFFKRFKEEYRTDRVKRLMGNLMVKVYRKHYTLEEVNQLIVFYNTPLGKKTLQVLPQVMQESQAEGAKLGAVIAEEVIRQMKN